MSTNNKTIDEEYVETVEDYVLASMDAKYPIKTPNDITVYKHIQSHSNSMIQAFVMTLVEFLGAIIRGVGNEGLQVKGYTKGSFFESIQMTAFIFLYGTLVYYATQYITPNLNSFEIYITHILGFFGILWAITLFAGDNKLSDYQT